MGAIDIHQTIWKALLHILLPCITRLHIDQTPENVIFYIIDMLCSRTSDCILGAATAKAVARLDVNTLPFVVIKRVNT